MTFDDNVRHFQTLDQNLKAQEKKIKRKINLKNTTTFFTVLSQNLEDLLQIEETITDQLMDLKINYQSISDIIPSQKRQLSNRSLIQEKLYKPRWQNLFKKLGLSREILIQKNSPFLTEMPSLPQPLKPLFKKSKQGYEGRILINNTQNKDTLIKIAHQFENVNYIDFPQEYSSLFNAYRVLIMKVILVVLAVILFLLAFIKGPSAAFEITGPVVLSMMATLSLLSFCNVMLTLFHMMGLLLVLCIGIDYALFLYWCKKSSQKDFFLLANTIAALTTIFSFGLLSFSGTAAVQNFGLCIFIGITFSFFITTLYLGEK